MEKSSFDISESNSDSLSDWCFKWILRPRALIIVEGFEEDDAGGEWVLRLRFRWDIGGWFSSSFVDLIERFFLEINEGDVEELLEEEEWSSSWCFEWLKRKQTKKNVTLGYWSSTLLHFWSFCMKLMCFFIIMC